MASVIIAGSFDPVTSGHYYLIKKGSILFDHVIVAVMDNREKTYLFSLDQREEMMKLACTDLSNVKVVASHAMLYEFCNEQKVFTVLKGVRNEEDYRYEMLQADFNAGHGIDTIFLPAVSGMEQISSTVVRKSIMEKKSLTDLVPRKVAHYIKQLNP